MEKTQVLIAGGGPVGMTLAADLARRGIRCILVERNLTTTAHPKMDITNARSMELFRGVGLAGKLRQVAVPEDHCFDVSWINHFAGEELCRFQYPSVTAHRALIRAHNDGSQPSESPMRVSQVEIEPVLRRHIEDQPLVDVRFGVEFESLVQNSGGVSVTVRDKRTGTSSEIACDYLVGCDGGSSRVRACLDIGLSGEARTMQRFMVHFQSSRSDLLMRWGRAWHYQSAYGTLISQNDKDVWTLHSRIPAGTPVDSVNPSDLITQFVGEEIEHEVLVANPWVPHLLVADAYGKQRVLLAGDAAHQYIPTGGYGMNTGVGEAFDLGWKLAATLQGFGGPALVASYETERRPVALRNCAGSRRHNDVRVRIAQVYTPEVFSNDPAHADLRRAAGAQIAELGNAENESMGIELGYAYIGSPIVAPEGQDEWLDDPLHYHPTTAPGARLPSVFLRDGTSLYDALGPWFTLVLTTGPEAGAFAQVAAGLGVPLKLLVLDEPMHAALYKGQALLVRPDHHIAWRGNPDQAADAARGILLRSLGHAGSAETADATRLPAREPSPV